MKSPEDIAIEAMRLIRERGWVKGHREAADGRLCLAGAVSLATTGSAFNDKENRLLQKCAQHVIMKRVHELFGCSLLSGVMSWNDCYADRKTMDRLIDSLVPTPLAELLIPPGRKFKPFYPPIQGRKDWAHEHQLIS